MSIDVSQPYGPPQPFRGIAMLLCYIHQKGLQKHRLRIAPNDPVFGLVLIIQPRNE
jgi:hypothetical protein